MLVHCYKMLREFKITTNCSHSSKYSNIHIKKEIRKMLSLPLRQLLNHIAYNVSKEFLGQFH